MVQCTFPSSNEITSSISISKPCGMQIMQSSVDILHVYDLNNNPNYVVAILVLIFLHDMNYSAMASTILPDSVALIFFSSIWRLNVRAAMKTFRGRSQVPPKTPLLCFC